MAKLVSATAGSMGKDHETMSTDASFRATILSLSIETVTVDGMTTMHARMSCKGADDLVVDVPVVKFDGDGWIVGQGFAGNGWTGTRSPVRDGPTAADDGVRVSGMSHSDAPGHGMHPIRGEVRITKL